MASRNIVKRAGIYRVHCSYHPFAGRYWTLVELVEFDPRGWFRKLFDIEAESVPGWTFVAHFELEPAAARIKDAIARDRERRANRLADTASYYTEGDLHAAG